MTARTWSGVIAAPIMVGLVGLLLERTIIKRFYAVPIIAMLGTYAIGLIIREIVRGLLGGHYKSIPEPISGAFSAGGLDFSIWRTFVIATTMAVIAGSWLLLSRTSLGLRVRGALENPMPGPRLSIVAPTFNRAHMLPRFLESVRSVTSDCEILVVDNASTDDTRLRPRRRPTARHLSLR